MKIPRLDFVAVAYEHDIEHYFKNIPKSYNLYFTRDIPTSVLSSTYSLLDFPQNFLYAYKLIDILGVNYCKEFVELMIEAAEKYHMGYQKPLFEKYVNFEKFSETERRFFDWVKTYSFIRRYTEFLQDADKYIHPLLLFDREKNRPFPFIHPGTARLRCTEFLWKSQKRDVLLDLVYYNSYEEELKKLEEKLKVKFQKIETFQQYLKAYGYESYDHYKQKKKLIQYEPKYKIGYPEYNHFLKREQYIPYLYEILYHLFDDNTKCLI